MPAVQVRNMITLLVKNRQIVGEHADAYLAAMKQVETDRSVVATLKQKAEGPPRMPYWVRTALVLLPNYKISTEMVAQQVQLSANLHSETIDATGFLVLLEHAPDTINDRVIAMQRELDLVFD